MAKSVREKSRGLKFAEEQLLRHGWEHGKGLGRAANGISEAIKVKVKCDKGGVGHKEGEQFTFHWWDHVFNKASSSLQVESDQNGIKLKKSAEEEDDNGMISNKKPRKATLSKAKLYGCFVKSATLLSGYEQPEPKSSSSDDDSSSEEEDDQKLDLSSTTKLSDADLMKACGGRTAHKGARHGLTMSAKLARLEQQEAEFMAKYGKKGQPTRASTVCVVPVNIHSSERREETANNPQSRQMKKKRSGKDIYEIHADVSEKLETEVKPKKKKKMVSEEAGEMTDAVSTEKDVMCLGNAEVDHSHKTKRKHKKKKNKAEKNEEEKAPSSAVDCGSPEVMPEPLTGTKGKKKKKKKSSKHEEEEESSYAESNQPGKLQYCAAKNKTTGVLLEEAEVTGKELTVKQNRKKCKKAKLPIGVDVNVDDGLKKEERPPKKKKKSKD